LCIREQARSHTSPLPHQWLLGVDMHDEVLT
jgi:hypothetical protein